MVVDFRTGDIALGFRIDGIVEELLDVAVLPGAALPTAFGFKTDEIRRHVTMTPAGEGK